MKSCPECQAELETFEIACHKCGQVISSQGAIHISDIAPSKDELSESYQSWMRRSRECIEANSLEEASNALREAIKRSRVLEDPLEKEIEARKMLAEVLEKLGKAPEAADQYRIIAQETSSTALREHWLKKSQDLLASSSLAFDELFKREEFRLLLDEEVRYVPLYCKGCKRLLAEAEVYGFRRGLSPVVRCWCGTEERPLAKEDARHAAAVSAGLSMSSTQRARAIQIAGTDLEAGKKKSSAFLIALLLGWCGGHKFYLGESMSGWIYFFWFWTLVPLLLSLYEALTLAQMSLVSFNMTYNLDVILAIIIPDETVTEAKIDVFSLDSSEDNSTEVAQNGTSRKEM